MSILTVILFGTGAVLVYAGIKDVDPRDLIRDSLKASATNTPAVSNKPKPAEKPEGDGTVNV